MFGNGFHTIMICLITVLICIANLIGGTGGVIMSAAAAILATSMIISIIAGWIKNSRK